MPANLGTPYSVSFPVLLARPNQLNQFHVEGEVQGTAFSLGEDFMITAGHVVKSLELTQDQCICLGVVEDTFLKAVRVKEFELLEKDIALLKVDYIYPGSEHWFHRLKWLDSDLNPFSIIRTMGYAYGMHRVDDHQSIVNRCFEGHIVSRLVSFKPVGSQLQPFSAYELSFLVPRGLSGAPVISSGGELVVQGIVIGNTQTRMMVFRSEERIEETNQTTAVEQYDALTLGVAVTAREVMGLDSNLLGVSIRSHLENNGLLVSN